MYSAEMSQLSNALLLDELLVFNNVLQAKPSSRYTAGDPDRCRFQCRGSLQLPNTRSCMDRARRQSNKSRKFRFSDSSLGAGTGTVSCKEATWARQRPGRPSLLEPRRNALSLTTKELKQIDRISSFNDDVSCKLLESSYNMLKSGGWAMRI